MSNEQINKAYDLAVAQYAAIGVDANQAVEQLDKLPISLHCWQADDVKGLEV